MFKLLETPSTVLLGAFEPNSVNWTGVCGPIFDITKLFGHSIACCSATINRRPGINGVSVLVQISVDLNWISLYM